MNNRQRVDILKSSYSYIKASEDLGLLKARALRPVRLQLELLKPERILQRQGVQHTVAVFGSARIMAREQALAQIAESKDKLKNGRGDRHTHDALAAARRALQMSKYYDEARKFAGLLSRLKAPDGRRYFIVTGGGPGIMEAANRGAFESGAKTIGHTITLPAEQEPNPYITPGLCFQFNYFAIRKMHFLIRSRALVVFPGGFGTMDELFESLTLIQTGKQHRYPVILVGRDFWTKLINFDFLIETGMVRRGEADIFSLVDKAEEAIKIIDEFYKNADNKNLILKRGD
ncbi:MAG: LOG family protein [Elusimicrobia bacterium]|nr:LOG family protein [Elusimicrobiota bacterium]